MERNNNLTKIIIVTLVIIIIFVLAIVLVFFISQYSKMSEKADNSTTNNNMLQHGNEYNENDKILQDENLIIIDNTNETINRKYGKVEVVWIDEENNVIDSPLQPYLGGLTPVKFDPTISNFQVVQSQDSEWYNYDEQKWANAINSDGSYFVWIPRYAYRIIYYSNESYSDIIGFCDGRGLMKINEDGRLTRIAKNNTGIRETSNHYIVAPAFSKDTASGYRNGGWSKDLSGIWVAKYEMSMETEGVHIDTVSIDVGNIRTDNNIKAVSKPAVSSWRNIDINNCYLNSYNYDRNRDSHLMKSSEWGAIAYLSYSKYGTNGRVISCNTNSNYVTGGSNTVESVYLSNKNQSSNGNETGVYDLVGGAWEYIAAYIDNGYLGLSNYGGNTENDFYGSRSSKYKTIYNHDNQDNGTSYNQVYSNNNYSLTMRTRGDAIYEVSNSGYGNEAFNSNSSFFMQSDIPFLIRGGDYHGGTTIGLFSFNGFNGSSNSAEGYRVVLAF